MAPITGLGQATIGHQTLCSPASPRTPRLSPGTVARSARSVPAQKAPPEPVTISTRTRSSSPALPTVSMKVRSMT